MTEVPAAHNVPSTCSPCLVSPHKAQGQNMPQDNSSSTGEPALFDVQQRGDIFSVEERLEQTTARLLALLGQGLYEDMSSTSLTGDGFQGNQAEWLTMLEDPPIDPAEYKRAAASNMTIPIHQLSEDILIRVFHLLVESSQFSMQTRALPGWTYAMMEPANRAWPAVMGVCKYWRTLICNTPLLWTTITAGDVRWLELALTHSASAPVDIVLLRREVIPSSLPILSPYSDRIRFLQLIDVMEGDTELIASFLLETKFQQLEELRIQGFAGRDSSLHRNSIALELDQRHLPSLHTLRLFNAFVPLECPTVSALRVLDLSRMSLHPCMWAVTLDTFLRALERSTSLQELRFDWGLPFKWRETSNHMVALEPSTIDFAKTPPK